MAICYTVAEIEQYKQKYGIPPEIYTIAQEVVDSLSQNKTCPKAYQAWKARYTNYIAEAFVLKNATKIYNMRKVNRQDDLPPFEQFVIDEKEFLKGGARFSIHNVPAYHELERACAAEKAVEQRNRILIGSAVVVGVGLIAWGVHKNNSTKRQL